MTTKLRIVAANLDTTQLNMYLENGDVVSIAQGDPRLPKIIEAAATQIPRFGYADISLEPDVPKVPHFEDVEKKSNGLVRFFRVAKEKIKHLFEPEKPAAPLEPVTIGVLPSTIVENILNRPQVEQLAKVIDQVAETKAQQHLAAAAEIAKHAVTASDPKFLQNVNEQQRIVEGSNGYVDLTPKRDTTARAETSDTIVAIVDGKVIPGMEKISNQFARASSRGSVVGVTKFLERLAAVIDKRSHSVEDVLKFMERADLPIADDGTIIGYKVLNSAYGNVSRLGTYVDCYTSSVAQSVGTYVHMDEKLVDHNRNNECSNGLHVARRGYIREFAGDVITVIKMKPEDVIAVPTYDANKIRVCGYHIIHELSSQMQTQLRMNKPITDLEEGRVLLAKLLKGEHIGVIEFAKIGGHKGTNVVHTPVGQQKTKVEPSPIQPAPKPVENSVEKPIAEQVKGDNQEHALADGPDNSKAATVDPNAVDKVVAKEIAKSKKEIARGMFDSMKATKGVTAQAHAKELLEFKKKSKKGWDILGITDKEIELVKKLAE